ncbi:MAG TPA: glycosyl hydrolase family 8 [Patescibacteria group bacterium]|nr:glycosyl hydrolase family 8 [Patescibacteria group bacterium]
MNILSYYKIMEFDTARTPPLPSAPTDQEKYMYLKRGNRSLIFFSIISFIGIYISLFDFLGNHTALWPLYVYLVLTGIYFVDSIIVNFFSKDFDIKKHKYLVNKWSKGLDRRVDVFLPTAGEDISILQNTWNGILDMTKNFGGKIQVYCLDDSARTEVKTLAEIYGFNYIVRPKRGWFKKSGNLRYGYKVSNGEFIAIFDADFKPRADFLNELLPYLLEYKDVGLVQSPQYFDVNKNQNWLQRGAGEVQELFYRMCQVSRQSHNASICVGSNALYRRDALAESGGTALIQHSEDVHTGFNMRMKGWTIQYIPIVLAKGLCPDDMVSFFKQQYRWCMGSMTLLSSHKFWHTKISLKARLSYFSGFLYYIHTAISSFIAPIIPLTVLIFFPEKVYWGTYLYILPSIIFIQIIYPLWHRAVYGIEAWSTRIVYGWAHLYAIFDGITKDAMSWQPTGTKSKADPKYFRFRLLQIIFNLLPSIVWVYLAARQVIVYNNFVFIPILLSGIYYYLICAKISFFVSNSRLNFGDLFSANIKSVSKQIVIAMPLLILVSLGVLLFNANSLNIKFNFYQSKPIVSGVSQKKTSIKNAYANNTLIQSVNNDEILLKTWTYYKDNFVTENGQSIDPDRQYKTTSEGQSYILLRSVIINDKDTFEKSWSWTKENLQHKQNDKLFSWLWGGATPAKEKVIYKENATDADEDIALALILASYKWNNKEYLAEAKAIISDIWKFNVVKQNTRYYLLGGSQFNKPQGFVINPSYISPASYKIFSAVDKDHPWKNLAKDSYYLLQKINLDTPNTVGLPPNWILLSRSGKITKATIFVTGNSDMYGYDAFRTFWRVALDANWFDNKEAKDYLSIAEIFFGEKWNKDKKINAVYTTDGKVIDSKQSVSTYTGPLSVFSIRDKKIADEIYKDYYNKQLNHDGYWGNGKNYYDQNWAWFATALYSGNIKLPKNLP